MNVRRTAPAPRSAKASPKSRNRKKAAPPRTRPQTSAQPPWRQRAKAVRNRTLEFFATHKAWWRRLGQLVLLAGAAATTLWFARTLEQYVRTADAFSIRNVLVEGNQQLGDMQVRRIARLRLGANIFEVSPVEARDHLLDHPWIEEAAVRRRLPGELRIEVVERRPVALVALDHLYLVSDDGTVFKRLGVDDPVDLPVITGLESRRFYEDYTYRTAVLPRSLAVLQDYEGAGLTAREPVSEIHFESPEDIALFVGQDGMHLRLGRGQHRQKFRRLRRILSRLEEEDSRPAYVYLDNRRRPDRVTVRLLENAR